MTEHNEKTLTVIDGKKTEEKTESATQISRQTNPIMKKLLEFHVENSGNFSVKDLFKK